MNTRRLAAGVVLAAWGVMGPAGLAHADSKDFTGDVSTCAAVGFPDAIGVSLDASRSISVTDHGLNLYLTSDHHGLIWTKTPDVTILRILVKGTAGSTNYRKYTPPINVGPLSPALTGGTPEIGQVLACITATPGSNVPEFPLAVVGPVMALGVCGAAFAFPRLRLRRLHR